MFSKNYSTRLMRFYLQRFESGGKVFQIKTAKRFHLIELIFAQTFTECYDGENSILK